MKIVYVILGILVFFSLPRFIAVSLARIAGMMAAVRMAPSEVLDSLEPRVNFWSGGLILWMLGLWGSYLAYLISEITFLKWIIMIFGSLSIVTFIMFIFDIRRRI
jgi:hypothetical protein